MNILNLRKNRQLASVCEPTKSSKKPANGFSMWNYRVLVLWECCQLGVFASWGCLPCASPCAGLRPTLVLAGSDVKCSAELNHILEIAKPKEKISHSFLRLFFRMASDLWTAPKRLFMQNGWAIKWSFRGEFEAYVCIFFRKMRFMSDAMMPETWWCLLDILWDDPILYYYY